MKKLFLDTASGSEVARYLHLIDGVTTNPSIIKKDGKGWDIKTLADICSPLPLSVEVRSEDPDEMFKQAHTLIALNDNVVVKIPIHSSTGTSYTQLIHDLSKRDVKVNVTAIMNVQQCLLAVKAGARYVSIFAGRIANMGYDPCVTISETHELLSSLRDVEIIAASVREAKNVTDWLLAGADIVTVTPEIFSRLVVHPYTKETVATFIAAAKETK